MQYGELKVTSTVVGILLKSLSSFGAYEEDVKTSLQRAKTS